MPFAPHPARSWAVLAVLFSLLVPRVASAHGLYGHIHVTGAAIENLGPGELRRMFQDPDVFQAALHGAMFPDTGYAEALEPADPLARVYGEHAHWAPFIEDMLDRIRTQYGPTYDTKEEQLAIAFLLGCASHGLQDEMFDSTFLYEVEQRDAPSGQDQTDPGLDGIFYVDGYVRLFPNDYVPHDDLVAVFQSTLHPDIDAALLDTQIGVVSNWYVNDQFGLVILGALNEQYRSQLAWASTSYLDPGVPGSFRAEIAPTRAYIEALWNRLHDRYDEGRDLVVQAWPAAPRRLREASAASIGSQIALVFSRSLMIPSVQVTLVDDGGAAQPFDLKFTRWSGSGPWGPEDESRMIRVRPTADLVPGAYYTLTLAAGAEVYRGEPTQLDHAFRFQVECASSDDRRCKPIPEQNDPVIDGNVPSGDGCAVSRRPSSPIGSLALVALAWLAVRRRSTTHPRPRKATSTHTT